MQFSARKKNSADKMEPTKIILNGVAHVAIQIFPIQFWIYIFYLLISGIGSSWSTNWPPHHNSSDNFSEKAKPNHYHMRLLIDFCII